MNLFQSIHVIKKLISGIDFLFIAFFIMQSILQMKVIDFFIISPRWDLIIHFSYWLILFKSGVDLFFTNIYKTSEEISLLLENLEWKMNIPTWRKNTLLISVVLMTVSFIPMTQLVLNQERNVVLGFSVYIFILCGMLIFRWIDVFSNYAEFIDITTLTFLFPVILNNLYMVEHNRLLLFTTLPFFLILSALWILRSLDSIQTGSHRYCSGIVVLMNISSLFLLVIASIITGFVCMAVMRVAGMGFRLLPEILLAGIVGIAVIGNIRLAYLENKSYFRRAYRLSFILIIITYIVYYLKIPVN